MKPEELLNKLKVGSSLKIQQSLDAIYEICTEQQERGIHDFSISTIAKLGNNRGVPKAQSIRNKTGEKYRALIQCFADLSTQNLSYENHRKVRLIGLKKYKIQNINYSSASWHLS